MGLIAVHGATGFTGGLVCHELAERGLDFVIAGRNQSKLEARARELAAEHDTDTAIRVVDALEPGPLAEMLRGVRVVINCVGPFVDFGPPVVRAAVEAGAHYLDTTGEQAFMHRVKDEFDKAARDAGSVICPGCAYEWATGDCAAAMLAEHGVRDIVVAYATTSAESSQGTKKSIVRILSEPGRTFIDGEEVERPPAYRTFSVPLGGKDRTSIWIPGGEVLSVPMHHPEVQSVEVSLVTSSSIASALSAGSKLIPKLANLARPLLYRAIERTSSDPHEEASGPNRFATIAFDSRHKGSRVEVKGEGPYVLTAKVISEAAVRLSTGEPRHTGYSSPAMLFPPRELMEVVGCTVTDTVADD